MSNIGPRVAAISWGYGVREEGAAIMAPKFELFKDEDGKFRFRLKADDGEIIVASQGYASKAAATTGIESVMKNAPVAAVDDQT
jgi:uncharacterized protein YegP (UPF0339 family)